MALEREKRGNKMQKSIYCMCKHVQYVSKKSDARLVEFWPRGTQPIKPRFLFCDVLLAIFDCPRLCPALHTNTAGRLGTIKALLHLADLLSNSCLQRFGFPIMTLTEVANGTHSRGHIRVTHHYRDGQVRQLKVARDKLAEVEPRARRRRVSIAWDDAPRLVLVACTPHNSRALDALPVLLNFLQRRDDVVTAIEQHICERFPGVPIVMRKRNDMSGRGIKLSQSMDNLSLTESAVKGPLQGRTIYQPEDVDLVICLGGDGLILHVISHLFPKAAPLFMPFNLGSLGFLTPFDFANHQQDVDAVLAGQNNCVTMRMRLKCVIIRQPVGPNANRSPCIHNFQDNMLNDEAFECSATEEYHVLNEMVIDRGPAPYLSNLEVFCDDCPVTRVQADGIIVATPTGSTAYSLSSGGSMVHPAVPAILFTPICPHSLSFRPVLFPDYVTLQIKVPDDSRASAWVSFDGRHRMELMRGDKVIVSVSAWPVPTFSRKDTTNDWFASVSQCLRWNERVVQGSH